MREWVWIASLVAASGCLSKPNPIYQGEPGDDATTGAPRTPDEGDSSTGTVPSADEPDGPDGDPTATGEPSTSGDPGDPSGSTGDHDGTGSTGDVGTGGVAGDCPMSEPEPNDGPASAVVETDLSVCEGPQSASFDGVIADANDQDWFSFSESWSDCDSGDADFVVTTGASMRACIFYLCTADAVQTPSHDCEAGSSLSTAPNGWPGCCGGASISMKLNCSNNDDSDNSADMLLMIESMSDETCQGYSVDYDVELELIS